MPELHAAGMECVYIVFGSEVGVGVDAPFGGLATGAGLVPFLTSKIGSRYKRDSAAVLICDELIQSFNFSLEMSKQIIEAWAIHEVTHLIDGPQLTASDVAACMPVSVREWADAAVVSSREDISAGDGYEFRHGVQATVHGPRFGRLMFHLAGRMLRSGRYPFFDVMHNWQTFGNVDWVACMTSLVAEIIQHEHEPLSKIKSLPMPGEFERLWTADIYQPEFAHLWPKSWRNIWAATFPASAGTVVHKIVDNPSGGGIGSHFLELFNAESAIK